MKEILLNSHTKIYVGKVKDYNKDVLLNQFKTNFQFSAGTKLGDIPFSGKQSIVMVQSNEINNVKRQCIHFIESISNNASGLCYTDNWIYINDKDTDEVFFHHHIENKEISFLKNQWVYTFYLQMPNNLKDDEGYLLFKTNDDIIHKILPKEGDVVIFPADLLHTPTLAPNSTNERIVFGGVYSKIDTNVEYLKTKKTFI